MSAESNARSLKSSDFNNDRIELEGLEGFFEGDHTELFSKGLSLKQAVFYYGDNRKALKAKVEDGSVPAIRLPAAYGGKWRVFPDGVPEQLQELIPKKFRVKDSNSPFDDTLASLEPKQPKALKAAKPPKMPKMPKPPKAPKTPESLQASPDFSSPVFASPVFVSPDLAAIASEFIIDKNSIVDSSDYLMPPLDFSVPSVASSPASIENEALAESEFSLPRLDLFGIFDLAAQSAASKKKVVSEYPSVAEPSIDQVSSLEKSLLPLEQLDAKEYAVPPLDFSVPQTSELILPSEFAAPAVAHSIGSPESYTVAALVSTEESLDTPFSESDHEALTKVALPGIDYPGQLILKAAGFLVEEKSVEDLSEQNAEIPVPCDQNDEVVKNEGSSLDAFELSEKAALVEILRELAANSPADIMRLGSSETQALSRPMPPQQELQVQDSEVHVTQPELLQQELQPPPLDVLALQQKVQAPQMKSQVPEQAPPGVQAQDKEAAAQDSTEVFLAITPELQLVQTSITTPEYQLLLEKITNLEKQLQDANYRNGYLETRLTGMEDQVKFLTQSHYQSRGLNKLLLIVPAIALLVAIWIFRTYAQVQL